VQPSGLKGYISLAYFRGAAVGFDFLLTMVHVIFASDLQMDNSFGYTSSALAMRQKFRSLIDGSWKVNEFFLCLAKSLSYREVKRWQFWISKLDPKEITQDVKKLLTNVRIMLDIDMLISFDFINLLNKFNLSKTHFHLTSCNQTFMVCLYSLLAALSIH